ncbi:MAG: glutamate racemase [Xenophilus sp.]
MHAGARAPIGVFDSGVGGLSVLQALREALPHERFVYHADSAHAPYGERGDAYVLARSRAVAQALIGAHGAKALVVACNTATAAAIHALRAAWPGLPVVGLEPALKPAVAASRTGRIAVLATRGTLASAKFLRLREAVAPQAQVVAVPCDGLADAIERADAGETEALCARYMRAAGPFGPQAGETDTVVLGCTHYPFALDALRRHAPAPVRFLDTGRPVATRTRQLLAGAGLLAPADAGGGLVLTGSGALLALEAAAHRWLKAVPPAQVSKDTDPAPQMAAPALPAG